ncbi:hypothetical protein HYY69_03155 [Candidatus Woesearchaeota archaeon]|nr:hypothetical protein [Candidatus Woesearchaeota archaeon]
MQINQLQAKQGKVEIQASVVEKGTIREFQKFGTPGRVCNAKLSDASGQIAFTLWNEQIDQIDVGDVVKVTNGYVNEWQGELQLTTGKFGKLEVVEKGAGAPSSSSSQSKTSPSSSPKTNTFSKPKQQTFDDDVDDIRDEEEVVDD